VFKILDTSEEKFVDVNVCKNTEGQLWCDSGRQQREYSPQGWPWVVGARF